MNEMENMVACVEQASQVKGWQIMNEMENMVACVESGNQRVRLFLQVHLPGVATHRSIDVDMPIAELSNLVEFLQAELIRHANGTGKLGRVYLKVFPMTHGQLEEARRMEQRRNKFAAQDICASFRRLGEPEKRYDVEPPRQVPFLPARSSMRQAQMTDLKSRGLGHTSLFGADDLGSLASTVEAVSPTIPSEPEPSHPEPPAQPVKWREFL